jgi:cell division septum initiation protein DivIVA
MYEEFVCWGKTVIGAKEAFNADASARIESMETYLADLKAGRIEITTERADLTKEIEQLNADIELATDMREKAKNDFTEASAEMDQAIKALNAAIEVLGTATKEHKGAFLRMKDSIGENSVAATAEAATLSNAIKLGDKFLTRGDSLFLRRLLAADVPEKDWKKLNRKATFKMSYKARSTKIQDVLAKLLETFESNLSDAKKKGKRGCRTLRKDDGREEGTIVCGRGSAGKARKRERSQGDVGSGN